MSEKEVYKIEWVESDTNVVGKVHIYDITVSAFGKDKEQVKQRIALSLAQMVNYQFILIGD